MMSENKNMDANISQIQDQNQTQNQIQNQIQNQNQIQIEIVDSIGNGRAETAGEQAVLAFEGVYEDGDRIIFRVPEANCFYVLRVDEGIEEALVYLTEKELVFEIPFEERKKSYNPKAFSGERHYLSCRRARETEWNRYRNLAKNTADQHGDHACYPHASANVETRGESVFMARNAIDGVCANTSHGSWPYESWGINKRADAEFRLEFGMPVNFDQVVIWLRADFPHDSYWESAELECSDGSVEVLHLKKQKEPQAFSINKENITWIRLKNLKKTDDESPFPALTQIEIYGMPQVKNGDK
ncbi:carbohydrate-binding protein [Brotaphodocola sp.]|uniref:carbohydrate-binding protein n=1 Tax=Brotaphodocola sp. TaxID=3073577 RepID=UPI003D7D14CD